MVNKLRDRDRDRDPEKINASISPHVSQVVFSDKESGLCAGLY